MISRLLLTTAIGFALGSAAFAQGTTSPSATDSSVPAATSASPANATVKLSEGVSVTPQDRARIGDSVARMNVKSLRGVDFSVSAGAKVPRELRVHRLPAEVGQIVPEYRDYRFLVVEKDIVIVEPKANKIVAVLKPDTAAAVANAAPAAPAPIKSAPASAPETPVATAPVAAAPAAAAPVVTATPAAPASPPTPAPAAAAATPAAPASTAAAPVAAPTAPAAVASTPAATEPSSASVPSNAAENEKPKAKKQASRSQRRNEARHSSAEVRVGQRVPDDVVLYRVPPRYYYEVPVMRDYRSRAYVGTWRGRPVYQEYD